MTLVLPSVESGLTPLILMRETLVLFKVLSEVSVSPLVLPPASITLDMSELSRFS